MNFYIFRHGETYQSKNEIPYGQSVESAEILVEGITVVKKMANFLKGEKIDSFYSSPYFRCKQTADIISQITGKQFMFDDDLGEFRREKEMIAEFIARVKRFFDRVRVGSESNIAICTHGYVVAALRELSLHGFVQEEKLDDYPKTGVIVHAEGGKINSIDFNK